MRLDPTDTIAAISTPPGENGIGIIRLSGPSAIGIAEKIFMSKKGQSASTFKSHTIHYGHIADNGKRIDEVLFTVMRAPTTYTCEDIVEINCHSGIVVLRKILDLVISKGARLAEPGEFTKRAFLNGRIDLAQAEAVLDVINSRTTDSLRIAQRQLNGESSRQLKGIRSRLIEILSDIEADINFPEEELAALKVASLRGSLSNAENELTRLIESSDKGLILREGITTVICGKPNVGKSSIMNNFLRQERVIVTAVPGTTRDTIEEVVNIRGIPLKIVDTAGIIHAEDEPAMEGIKKSIQYLKIADLILLVLDSNDRLTQQDIDIIDMVRDKKTIVVVNKTDLPEVLQVDEIKKHLHANIIVKISAKEKHGIEKLEEAIYNLFWSGKVTAENIFISNSRHIKAVGEAIGFIREAIKGIDEKMDWEFVSLSVRSAAESIGIITGELFTEDLLDVIFSKFCIGK